jgi:single-strand DNA-binding protein
MLNRVILIGRLTKDPEMRYTPAGVAVTQFTLAIDRPFTGNQGEKEADFIPVVAWRQLAELSANYLRKGRLTAVEGRIQVRNYENNEGKRVYVTEIIADNVRFLESNRDGNQRGEDASYSRNNGANASHSAPSEFQANSGYNSGKSSGTTRSNRANGTTRNDNNDPFSNDGRPIDISEDDLPF